MPNAFKFGDYSAICDRCGFNKYASELKLQWNGLRVCRTCYEPRNAQDFVRGVPDPQAVPWVRDEPPDQFISITGLLYLDGNPLYLNNSALYLS